ncbi:Accumulation of dyads protein 2 [Yarrowia sp. B02]|nr:Accumulation of dyads protein 2 [Yarrowia sp. B02]
MSDDLKPHTSHPDDIESPYSHQDEPVMMGKVRTSGEQNEYIHLGGIKYHKDEFARAFGGTLNPGSAPVPTRQFGNAAPSGLFAFSMTMFILGMCLVNARNVHAPNVMVGCAFFGGGLIEVIAGIWEIVAENTFAATVFFCFGCFWFSWSMLNFPIGIEKYYSSEDEFSQAVGIFLMGWFIFAFLMTLCTLKATVAFFLLFVSLDLALIFLAAGYFQSNTKLTNAGGAFCISTGLLGCWNGYAGVASPQSTYKWLIPKAVMMPGAHQ